MLNIDEVLFASLAPARLRQLYGAVRPLALPSVRTWRGLDLRALLTAAAVFSTLAVAYTSVLVPQRDLLVSARDALCAGDRDFVYTRDGLGAVAWAYPDRVDASELHKRNFPDGRPPPVNVATMANEAVTANKESFAVSTIDNLLRQSGRAPFAEACDNDVCYIPSELSLIDKPGRPDCCFAIKTKVPSTDAGRFSLFVKNTETTVDATRLWNPGCFDALDGGAGYQNLLQGAMGDAVSSANVSACGGLIGCPAETPMCDDGECVVPTCARVASYCRESSVAGVRARQLCPQTCGCTDPRSALALGLPSSGCGDRCVRSGVYLDALSTLPCEDVPVADPQFAAFLNDWDRVRQSWPNDWNQGSMIYIAALRARGCGFLGSAEMQMEALTSIAGAYPPYLFGINPCVEGGTFFPVKPLSYFCPEACACRAGDAHCPRTCPARNTTDPLCTDVQNATYTLASDLNRPHCPLSPEAALASV